MIYSWSLSSEVTYEEMGGLVHQVDHAIALQTRDCYICIDLPWKGHPIIARTISSSQKHKFRVHSVPPLESIPLRRQPSQADANVLTGVLCLMVDQ